MKTGTKIKLIIAVLFIALLGVYTAIFVPFGPTVGEKIKDYDSPRAALFVMDMQVDLVDKDGRLPVDQGQVPAMLAATNRLVTRADEIGVEPIYVVNAFSKWDLIGNLFRNQAVIAGSEGARLDPRLKVVSEALFIKDMPDAFTNLELDQHLQARQINHIIMTGVFADQCVRATAIGALNRGYKVTVLKEAVAAASTEDRDQAYRDLEEDGATVISVEKFIDQRK